MDTKIRNLIAGTVAAATIAVPAVWATSVISATPAASAVDSVDSVDSGPVLNEGSASKSVQAMHRYQETANASGATNWQTMDELLTFTIQDVDGFWTGVFASVGYQAPQVSYRWLDPGEAVAHECGTDLTNDRDAFYCPGDDTIYVSKQMMVELWEGKIVGPEKQTIDFGGDFAVAAVIAHEYAHNLQMELNLFTTNSVSETELQADCLTGVWARNAEGRNLLDPGDIAEGMKTMFLFGDDDILDLAGHHGTPAERQAAFQTGYTTGQGAACDTYVAG
jgi:predicted metalloprotease